MVVGSLAVQGDLPRMQLRPYCVSRSRYPCWWPTGRQGCPISEHTGPAISATNLTCDVFFQAWVAEQAGSRNGQLLVAVLFVLESQAKKRIANRGDTPKAGATVIFHVLSAHKPLEATPLGVGFVFLPVLHPLGPIWIDRVPPQSVV